MESTTQHNNGKSFSLSHAQNTVNRCDWQAALTECEGLFNSSPRTYFTNAEVWILQAIAQARLGRLVDAEYSYSVARGCKNMSDELDARYVRHVIRYYRDQGNLDAVNKVLPLLKELPGRDVGWVRMTRGRTHYRKALAKWSRGRRDDHLQAAARSFQKAEDFWATSENELADRLWRTKNLTFLFRALANQSHGYDNDQAMQALRQIALRNPALAVNLRRKLRWIRKGFKSY